MAADRSFPQPPEPPPGISLEELAAAFAQAMGGGAPAGGEQSAATGERPAATAGSASEAQAVEASSPGGNLNAGAPLQRGSAIFRERRANAGELHGGPKGESVATEDCPPDSPPEDADEIDDACPITPASVLEAMLFVGNRDGSPLTPARAAELMRGVAPGEIAGLVDELNARYAADGRPYAIVSEGSGYRLRLRPEFAPLRNRFYGKMREVRLSQAAIDILAIVAYQQPLTAEEINKLRGKPSGHVLSQLVHRQLLRIERAGPRRTAQYYTTERFLRLFGLESLDDLPRD